MNEDKKTISEKELETLSFWQNNKIFEKSIESPAGEEPVGTFSFYDGPPFATGVPHHGHILAGTIKDVIPRYQTMLGNSVRRVWGWDCHGLPLENLVEKKFNLKHKKDIEAFGIQNFNEAARAMVLEYEHEWKKAIPRLGRFVDMEHPYKTMDSTYTESIWWSFKTLYDKGLIYEGNKIMHICPRCETTLAQSEVAQGYMDVTDISVYAKFRLVDDNYYIDRPDEHKTGTYLIAWTTTPWTLPGNVALAVNKEETYIYLTRTAQPGKEIALAVTTPIQIVVIKEALKSSIFKKEEIEGVEYYIVTEHFGNHYYKVDKEVKGEYFIGKEYEPLFEYFKDVQMPNKENIYKVVAAPFVTADNGTGIVHIAPAFGQDDYDLARAENLPIIKHVNMDGTFTKEMTEADEDFKGVYVKQKGDYKSADIVILKKLQEKGLYFSKESIKHSYPHCWRCETPLLNYATSSWFMDILKIKGKLISENKDIQWVPEHIQEGRFGKWLEGARDWALSRNRFWGAPLPVWKCSDCSHVEVFGSMSELQTRLVAQNTYSVMRHGQSIGNTKDQADSSSDPENHLTEEGKNQVKESVSKIKEGDYDLIIYSPVLRAKETAFMVKESLGMEDENVIEDSRLGEFCFGVNDGRQFSEFWEDFRVLHYDFDAKMDGSESYREIQGRLTNLLFDCEEKYRGMKILFVTHGAPMWMLIALTNNMSDNQAREYRHAMMATGKSNYFLPNASIISLDFKPYPHSAHGLDFHRPYIDEVVYKCSAGSCAGGMKRINDVFDCWYESGSMPFAQFHYPFENKELFEHNFPAGFIAEGLDQTRGWFYSMLNLSVGLFDKSSYKRVIVNGLTLAADGQKMSKSKNNFTDPMVLVDKYGADALRFALISGPLVRAENVAFPDSLIDEVYKKVIMRLENVFAFYSMYKDDEVVLSTDSENVLDLYIIARLNSLIRDVTNAMNSYELDSAARPFETFVDDLSTWYVRRSRERLKGDEGELDRKQAISTLGYVLRELSKTMAPFMPFIAERIYKYITSKDQDGKESVHLERWPEARYIDELVISNMDYTRKLVSLGLEARNKFDIKVRQPLKSITVKNLGGLNAEYIKLIQDELNIKEVLENQTIETEIGLDTEITPELQMEGDYRELTRLIKDLRKDAGMSQGDVATLTISFSGESAEFFIERSREDIIKSCGLDKLIVQEKIEGGKEIILSKNTYLLRID